MRVRNYGAHFRVAMAMMSALGVAALCPTDSLLAHECEFVCPVGTSGHVDCATYPGTGCPPDRTAYDGCCCGDTPVLVDILGNGFHLTSAEDGVTFDFFGNGKPVQIAWTAFTSDDAWLVLDRNGNGRIDDGGEMFGSAAPQPWSLYTNGFLALAEYDKLENGGNRDGVIDAGDSVFASLRLWQDRNHNGVSEAGELHPLPALGVSGIGLKYHESRRVDEYGNLFRYRAKVYRDKDSANTRWAWDVGLKVLAVPSDAASQVGGTNP